ncbi:hypothetical protein AVEN_273087-1, partial [Araneus ventricosus]
MNLEATVPIGISVCHDVPKCWLLPHEPCGTSLSVFLKGLGWPLAGLRSLFSDF